MKFNTKQLLTMLSSEDSDGIARVVDVNTATASATKDHPTAPEAEANSDGVAAGAADLVKAGGNDGVTPTIQDAINKGEQVGEDITKMEAAVVSTEHHIALVTNAIDANEALSPTAAAAIKVSLELHDAVFFSSVIPSVEAFSARTGRMTATMNTLARLHDCKAGLANAITGATTQLTKIKASLEAEDGTAIVVDVKETSATLKEVEVTTSEDDGSKDHEVANAHQNVDTDFDDFTAIDEASKKQGEEIHKRLERLEETSSSLEAYIGILRKTTAAGQPVGSDAVSVIRQDLQSRYPKFFKDIAPSLEAFDTDLVVSNELADELGSKLKAAGGAIEAAMKKFWAWVKSIYVKVKALIKQVFGIVELETKKTTYLLAVTDAIPEKGKAPKSLPAPPAGVTSKAAAKVQLLIGHEKKVVPPKELPKTVRVAGTGMLESVENDLWGMGSRETGGLTHIHDYYTNMMWRAANHLKKDVITATDVDAFEKDIQALAKFPTTAIFAGNKKFAYKEGTASLKLVDSGAGGKSYEEVEMLSKADIKQYLEKNATLLGNIKWIGESWEKTLTMLSELDTKVKSVENAEIKGIVTKRITEFLNSDVDVFFKLCTEVAAKRNQLLDHMLMIHADCAGTGNEK